MSVCDVCGLLAIGLECTGAPGTALRGAMIIYICLTTACVRHLRTCTSR